MLHFTQLIMAILTDQIPLSVNGGHAAEVCVLVTINCNPSGIRITHKNNIM